MCTNVKSCSTRPLKKTKKQTNTISPATSALANQKNSHVGNTRRTRFRQRQPIRPKARTRIDQRTVLIQTLRNRLMPFQPADRRRIQRRQQRQIRIVIVDLAQVLHDLDELADVFLTISCVVLAQNLRSCPVRHLVEVLRETRQIRRSFFALFLRPDQHFGYFDFLEQFGVEQRHLGGQIAGLEFQQRWRTRGDRPAGERRRIGGLPALLLEEGDFVEDLLAQQFGADQLAGADQLVDELDENGEVLAAQVGRSVEGGRCGW